MSKKIHKRGDLKLINQLFHAEIESIINICHARQHSGIYVHHSPQHRVRVVQNIVPHMCPLPHGPAQWRKWLVGHRPKKEPCGRVYRQQTLYYYNARHGDFLSHARERERERERERWRGPGPP